MTLAERFNTYLRKQPVLGRGVYLAKTAVVLGDVTLGAHASVWYGAVLRGDINRIVKDPEFAQRIASDGLIPAGGPPERLLKLLTEEITNWAKVAERAGLKVQ